MGSKTAFISRDACAFFWISFSWDGRRIGPSARAARGCTFLPWFSRPCPHCRPGRTAGCRDGYRNRLFCSATWHHLVGPRGTYGLAPLGSDFSGQSISQKRSHQASHRLSCSTFVTRFPDSVTAESPKNIRSLRIFAACSDFVTGYRNNRAKAPIRANKPAASFRAKSALKPTAGIVK